MLALRSAGDVSREPEGSWGPHSDPVTAAENGWSEVVNECYCFSFITYWGVHVVQLRTYFYVFLFIQIL